MIESLIFISVRRTSVIYYPPCPRCICCDSTATFFHPRRCWTQTPWTCPRRRCESKKLSIVIWTCHHLEICPCAAFAFGFSSVVAFDAAREFSTLLLGPSTWTCRTQRGFQCSCSLSFCLSSNSEWKWRLCRRCGNHQVEALDFPS
jgi:hypothetical protein